MEMEAFDSWYSRGYMESSQQDQELARLASLCRDKEGPNPEGRRAPAELLAL